MSRLRSERGSVLIIAMLAVTMMLVISLATVSLIDRQQQDSGEQRHRESSLNLNEGVLYSQAFVLARNWPTASAGVAGAFPASCSSGAATTPRCPDRNALAVAGSAEAALANFSTTDYLSSATWVAKVRDNGGALAANFDIAAADGAQPGCPVTPCTLDANDDRHLWVQARTVVRGRPRSIAALLALELFRESFPRTAITAGHVTITNSGNHGGRAIVDNAGSQIALRCNPRLSSCADYRSGQISQPAFTRLPTASPTLSARQLERLKARARMDGRYFATCPPSNANLAGAVVWVEDCASASYSSSLASAACTAPLTGRCINTLASPGALIWHKGTVTFTGNLTFVGLISMVNDSDGSGGLGADDGPVLELGGGFSVYGAVAIDGQGGLAVGSNAGPNIKYDANAFNLGSYGTAGLVQNLGQGTRKRRCAQGDAPARPRRRTPSKPLGAQRTGRQTHPTDAICMATRQ
jgi:hypothetical protein